MFDEDKIFPRAGLFVSSNNTHNLANYHHNNSTAEFIKDCAPKELVSEENDDDEWVTVGAKINPYEVKQEVKEPVRKRRKTQHESSINNLVENNKDIHNLFNK